jgi:hypothetical protein
MKTLLNEGNLEIYSEISFGGRGARGAEKKKTSRSKNETENLNKNNK